MILNHHSLQMTYKVFTGNPADIEAGFEPHLEAIFRTLKEAEEYAQLWRNLYPDGRPDFWVAS